MSNDNYGFRCNCGDPLCRAQLLEDYTGEELAEALSMVHLSFQGRNVIGALAKTLRAIRENLTPEETAEVMTAWRTEPLRMARISPDFGVMPPDAVARAHLSAAREPLIDSTTGQTVRIGGPTDFRALLERYLTKTQLDDVIKAVQKEPWRFRGLKVMESHEGALEFWRRATENPPN